MKIRCLVALAALTCLSGSPVFQPVFASSQAQPSTAPTIVRLDGTVLNSDGQPRTGAVVLVISMYADQYDTNPVWSEEQTVILDAAGRYAVLVGSTLAGGIPRELFAATAASGAGRWLGVTAQGGVEQPRVMILSVPYAAKAGDAETLAGKPLSEFVLSQQLTETVRTEMESQGVVSAAGEDGPSIQGTSGKIAKFDGTGLPGNVIDSIITESGGNIGIGTVMPAVKLDVFEAVTQQVASFESARSGASDGTYIGLKDHTGGVLHDTALFGSVNGNLLLQPAGGKVGIGTKTPVVKFHVFETTTQQVASFESATSGATQGTYIGLKDHTGGVTHDTALIGSVNGNLVFQTAGGNVGIGTAAPTDKLHVIGNVTVSGNIGAKYQDVAEWVESVAPIEAGTVVIVDPFETNRVIPATTAYDTRVAGAVSAQPGLILGEKGDNNSKSLVAQSGRVRIKVDTKYGAIKIGDLLVTSATPGHAMVSKPIKIGGQQIHRPGTLLGKALEPLAAGKGEILVLLTLQ